MKKLKIVIPSLAALFWGSSIIFLYATGRIGEFLVPKFHLITLIGGLGMVVLGLFVLLTLREGSDCDHDHCDHDHHQQSPLAIILLMILPLSAALATDTSRGYSADVLEQKGLYENRIDPVVYTLPPYTQEMLETSTPRSASGHFQLPINQIYFSSQDPSMMEIFEGIPVEVTGQLIKEKINNESGNRLRLYHTIMTCCAADAMVLGMSIEFQDGIPTFEERAWFKVMGTLTYETPSDKASPLLQVESFEEIEPPKSSLPPSNYNGSHQLP